ncbi:PucR family transcriptional regulator [Streptomyces ipomoeae]|uniref:PucR family transcriptional regulator n=2 Tax=Streptomyces ipomoeae TaxID=103232 RepID=A0AAE9B1P9_9ACTN|nr:helix-turn-helix domain-containing protein [Streptomyces ipomoeae]MDX2694110.1 helix-turn-helix domain-containing protein [Streptomyces ipomoeae]MDX2824227.1 helix-turn-helix domain-containing protein [Streptomyces ipomoeae]MDX2837778.1 helix-turn-helix domain-containing protein [Streptomyces ipomoeae]MDX2876856.1 helix-turn-helix domain-containing protein [Streptomyces ipomoeae]TQE23586.1 PucR family transcriptional regulator [Streptomyces ipomoeae]
MRDLIGRLEVVDDAAASALGVIDHFDSLVEERAPLAAVVRAAAALAGCAAGLHDAGRGLTRRYASDGRALPDETGPSQARARAAVPGRPGSWVWLERSGTDGPLDALILERSAKAVQTLTRDSAPPSADAAVRIACDPDASEADRRDAARRLGLTTGTVTVVVSDSAGPWTPHGTRVGKHVVTLLRGTPVLPPDVRAGTAVAGESAHLPTALEQARVALRLADRVDGPGPSVVAFDSLGALAAVAERITPQEAGAVGDVLRLDEVRVTRPWVIDTLQAVLDQASLRQAASELHVHHSTLQERLTWLVSQLGYAITKPGGRQRAAVALLLWRIAHSENENAGSAD